MKQSIVIKRYIKKDIPEMIKLVEDFFYKSRQQHINHYNYIDFDSEKLYKLLEREENNIEFFCNLIVSDNEIVGGLCAIVESPIYSNQRIAYDQIFYIKPEFVNIRATIELINSYVEWAKRRQVIECRLSSTTGFKIEAFTKLCNKNGFDLIGNNLVRKIE